MERSASITPALTGDPSLERVVHALVNSASGWPRAHGSVPSVLGTFTFMEQTPVALVVGDVIRWFRTDGGKRVARGQRCYFSETSRVPVPVRYDRFRIESANLRAEECDRVGNN